MLKKDFFSHVEKLAPPELKNTEYLKLAMTHIVDRESEIYKTNLSSLAREAILLAGRFKTSMVSQSFKENDEMKTETVFKVTEQNLLFSDYLLEKIQYWGEELRLEIFNSKEAPFEGEPTEALKWIESVTEKEIDSIFLKDDPNFLNERNKAVKEVMKISTKFNISFELTTEILPYLDSEKSKVKRIETFPGTTLYIISKEVKKLSYKTGFSPTSLTMYLLTGEKPILPAVKIIQNKIKSLLPDNQWFTRKSLTIDINVSDLTFNELKELYDSYRSMLNTKRKTSLSEEQIKYYRFVLDKGGPVKGKGATSFWREIQREWNKSNPNGKLGDANSAYKKFKRTQEKVQELF